MAMQVAVQTLEDAKLDEQVERPKNGGATIFCAFQLLD